MLGDDLRNERLVGFGGCGAEREADFGQGKLEQAIAAADKDLNPQLLVQFPDMATDA